MHLYVAAVFKVKIASHTPGNMKKIILKYKHEKVKSPFCPPTKYQQVFQNRLYLFHGNF